MAAVKVPHAEDVARVQVTKNCIICGPSPTESKFTKFGFRVVQCRNCGLVYLDHLVTPEDFRNFYSKEYFAGGEDRKGYADYLGDRDNIRLSFRHKLDKLKVIKPVGTLLDIGCAAGYFLEEAADRGWEVYGQEVSEYAAGVARERFGDHIFIGTIDAVQLPPDSLDVVTMWDVIEHLDDPIDTLERVRGWLKPDGVLAICTGNVDSWLARLQGRNSRMYNPPQHLYFFSDKTLSYVLEKAGFSVLERRNDWKSMSLEYISYVLATVNENPVSGLLHKVIRRSPWAKRPIPVPLVDNSRIYAVPRKSS